MKNPQTTHIHALVILCCLTFLVIGFFIFFMFHYYLSFFYRKRHLPVNNIFATTLTITNKVVEKKLKYFVEFDNKLRFFSQKKHSWFLFIKLLDNKNRNKLNQFIHNKTIKTHNSNFINNDLVLWLNYNKTKQKIYFSYIKHLSNKKQICLVMSNLPTWDEKLVN